MKDLVLERTYTDKYTRGELYTPFGLLYTLEKPNRNNKPRVSCIPEGRYTVVKSHFYTGKHKGKPAFRLLDVVGRSGILIHKGNKVSDFVGCIGIGTSFDYNRGFLLGSKKAFSQMWDELPDKFYISVRSRTLDFSPFAGKNQVFDTDRFTDVNTFSSLADDYEYSAGANNKKKNNKTFVLSYFILFVFCLIYILSK